MIKDDILSYLEEHSSLSRDIATELGYSRKYTQVSLRKLKREGKVKLNINWKWSLR